ncbi:MAG: thermonuclease family protein [Gammaproteobacteria bacterium]|nr:thermonuclease family protein [Gammaproteobacteria bacterium]
MLALALLASLFTAKEPGVFLHGQASRIIDGDTFILETGQRSLRIRLSAIDAPEKNQPYGVVATRFLEDLLTGKAVQVRDEGADKYRRTLGRVFVGNRDVNAALVEQGAAWVYRQYNHDLELLTLEAQAKAQQRGLWALPDPIAPWDWRKTRKSQKIEVRSEADRSAGCQPDKRTCKDMINCEEARFYLKHCNRLRLDGDKDGIPCETLCR